MKPTKSTRYPSFSLLAVLLSGSTIASASTIYINSPSAIPGTGETVAGFKVRASPTNWDASLSNTSATANTANFLQGELSNNFSGLGATIKFSIENRPGQGYVFTTDRSSGSGHSTITLAWGQFTPPVAATRQAAALNGIQPGAAFNTLGIDAVSSLTGSSVRVRDLLFTAPGMTITGAFADAALQAGINPNNSQWLVADTDLASIPWTLSGEVRLGRSNTAGGDEQVKFTVMARQGGGVIAATPEPGATLLLAGAAGLVAGRRRRRMRA